MRKARYPSINCCGNDIGGVHKTGDVGSHNHGYIVIGNPPKGGSGMQVMWAIVWTRWRLTNERAPSPQRPLYAGLECPRARKGKDTAGRWRDPRPRGFGSA